MAVKRRNIFLNSAIACLIGIIAIFIFDGYLGKYDAVYVTTGEYEQEIEADYWQSQRRGFSYPFHIGAVWGDSIHFRYDIINRRFPAYSATVEASVWKSNEKVIDLFRQDISLSGFDRVTMEWLLPAEDLERTGLGIGQYTIKIMRGEVELGQGIILDFRSRETEIIKPPRPAGY